MRGFKLTVLAALIVASPLVALADEGGAVIQMCAQGQETIAPDMADLTFSLTAKSADRTEAVNKANKMQRDASAFVKSRDSDARLVNQGYQTEQTYDKNSKPNGWQVSQYFVVKTKKLTDLDDMTAKLQELGLMFTSVNFSVTSELIDSLQDRLYKKAFANLQKRMDVITDGVRARKWTVESLDLMSNRPCNEAALHAAQMAVKASDASYYALPSGGRVGIKGYEDLGSGFAPAPVAAKIAAPTFDAADQVLKLNLWVSARIK
ncbi:MAG: SIMPL domain-containing protein [Formosimonas sp.]